MTTLLRTVVFTLLMASASIATSQIDILAGLGLSFGTGAETVGLQFRGDVDITDKWGGSLNITPYFKKDVSYWEINFDGHYMFLDKEPWSAYALAGLNLSTVGYKGVSAFGVNIPGASTTKVGLNVGGGARYLIADRIVLFGEIKYIISSFDQLVITVGGLYVFPI